MQLPEMPDDALYMDVIPLGSDLGRTRHDRLLPTTRGRHQASRVVRTAVDTVLRRLVGEGQRLGYA